MCRQMCVPSSCNLVSERINLIDNGAVFNILYILFYLLFSKMHIDVHPCEFQAHWTETFTTSIVTNKVG